MSIYDTPGMSACRYLSSRTVRRPCPDGAHLSYLDRLPQIYHHAIHPSSLVRIYVAFVLFLRMRSCLYWPDLDGLWEGIPTISRACTRQSTLLHVKSTLNPRTRKVLGHFSQPARGRLTTWVD